MNYLSLLLLVYKLRLFCYKKALVNFESGVLCLS